MIKIGFVGEDPNDTQAIINLLTPLLKERANSIILLRNKRGCQLDNKRTETSLYIEVKSHAPDIVVFVRDADAVHTQKEKIEEKKQWYEKLKRSVGNADTILLLNIYELEALILADIDTFNRIYKTKIKFSGDVSMKSEPKEFLIQKTWKSSKRYAEHHARELFSKLNPEQVQNRCVYFREFINDLSGLIVSSKQGPNNSDGK